MFSVYEMQHKYLNLSLPECSPGYQGPNCSYACRYPNYGDDCQSFCDCVELQCDHITGCRQLSNVHDYALHSSYNLSRSLNDIFTVLLWK